ncbi:MAG: carbohydrate-binding family 9-like protein [Lentisphaeria bacterium]|nr:carbohydrate-binding family 9-like protein [Lentisphaeria bacterium]
MSTMRCVFLTIAVFLAILATSCRTVDNATVRTSPAEYTVHRISRDKIPSASMMNFWTSHVGEEWSNFTYALWQDAELGTLSYVLPESKYKDARIEFKLVHDGKRIYAIFRAAKDRYILAKKIRINSFASRDTCAELFLAPGATQGGYCNMEVSLSGAYLFMFHKSQQSNFEGIGFISDEDTENIKVFTSGDGIVFPEIKKEEKWHIIVVFDAATIAKYAGVEIPEDLSGQTWNANFYHCAEASSHPRWLAWNPIPKRKFHLPNCFGQLHFE